MQRLQCAAMKLGLTLTCALLMAITQIVSASGGSARVVVRVIDSKSGLPLRSAPVGFVGFRWALETDSLGFAAFDSVPAGTHTLKVWKSQPAPGAAIHVNSKGELVISKAIVWEARKQVVVRAGSADTFVVGVKPSKPKTVRVPWSE